MNDTPLISVIIPCYNQSLYLSEALQSVIGQSYKHIEIVVINDGSDDVDDQKLISICSQFNGNTTIKYISIPNSGVAIARNIAIQQSKGAYIVPLDADDVIHPKFIEETLRELQSSPNTSFVYTDYQLFGEVSQTVLSEEYDLYKFLYERNICASTALIRKDAWQDAGGYNPNMVWGFEDWEFWISCGAKGHFGKRLPKPLFYYRKKLTSATRNTGANSNSRKLFARMALNHPNLFPLRRLDWAKQEWASAVKTMFETKDKQALRFIGNMTRSELIREIQILEEKQYKVEVALIYEYWLHQNTELYDLETIFEWGLQLEDAGQNRAARDAFNNALKVRPDFLPAKIALKRLEFSGG